MSRSEKSPARCLAFAGTVLAQPSPYETSQAYGLVSVPTSVLIDRHGRIARRVVGWDEQGLNDILEIAEHCEFEELAYLLIHGKLPNAVELAAYRARLIGMRGLPAGLMQVLVSQEFVGYYFGRQSGFRGLVIAEVAGVLTPGGPMVTVPLLVALAKSGAAMPSLVAYMTAWSLFGLQRIIAWEAPLMGWRFVSVRVLASLALPLIAGWLVAIFYSE